MLLQRWKQYAEERLALPPRLYDKAVIRYIVELDAKGRVLSPGPIDTADPSNRRTRRGQRFLMPQLQRASGIRPLLFASNAEYTFGLGREKSKPARVAACHAAYLDLVERCAAATAEPAIQAVWTFLQSGPVSHLALAEDFDRGAAITFRVDGAFPTELPSVQAFWAAEHDPAKTGAPTMQCLICGQERPVLTRLQAKIKGVPGGHTSGTSIISANAAAFESYGLKQSLIAPTCAECGEHFTKAANALNGSEKNSIVLGGARFVFWTRQEAGFSPLSYFRDPQPEQVRALLESARTGRPLSVDDTAFYATSLSCSRSRVVVRDWLDTTVGAAKHSLAQWFRRQQMCSGFGDELRPLKLSALAGATAHKLRDVPAPTFRVLLRTALMGAPLPMDLFYRAVRRNCAERKVTRSRAALLRLVLLSRPDTRERHNLTEDTMVKLNEKHENPAYQCGRLLATLENIQRQAIRNINQTVADRFYGSASSAPFSVLPRLIGGARAHLTKLRRDNRGAHGALQQRLGDIVGQIEAGQTESFPRMLTLEDQGFFALGYYHQQAHDRAQAIKRKEERDVE